MTPNNDRLEHLLQALGSAEPAPDFSHRLLANLTQAESSVPVRSRSRPFFPKFFAFAVTLLLVAGALDLHYLATKRSEQLGSSLSTRRASPLADSTLAAQQKSSMDPQSEVPAGVQVARTQDKTFSGPRPQFRGAVISDSQAGSAPSTSTAVFSLHLAASAATDEGAKIPTQAALDAQALADLHAPAQPAPQQNATGQERQLRLMLRQGERRELAQLTPAERDASAQQQTREFNAFFDPPLPHLETSLANRVYAPHAVTLDEVQQIDAAQHNGSAQISPSSSTPIAIGDSK